MRVTRHLVGLTLLLPPYRFISHKQAKHFSSSAQENNVRIQAIFVSPLRRALQMTRAIIDGLYNRPPDYTSACPPVYVADAIREQYSGQAIDQRRPLSQIRRENPRFDCTTYIRCEKDPWSEAARVPESTAELTVRCAELLQVLRRCPFNRILVVTHERLLHHLLAVSNLHVITTCTSSRTTHEPARGTDNTHSESLERHPPPSLGLHGFRSYAIGGWTTVYSDDATAVASVPRVSIERSALGFALPLDGLRVVHFLSCGVSASDEGRGDIDLLPEGIAQVGYMKFKW